MMEGMALLTEPTGFCPRMETYPSRDADQDPWMELLNVAVLLGKNRNNLNIQE